MQMDLNEFYEKVTTTDPKENLVIQNSYMAWGIFVTYIVFTKFVGPSIMKNKKPVELTSIMILYNFGMVFWNLYLSFNVVRLAFILWPNRCDFQSMYFSDERKKYNHLCISAFLLKFAELFDTVFFVLRKKSSHVSFLHVFHHSTVFIMLWICLNKNLLGYYIALMGSINFPVHAVMYSYYALAALGPNVRKYLWWKKYITRLQIMQFFVLIIHMSISFLTGCEKFGNFEKFSLFSLLLVTGLFLNFYRHAYKDGLKKRSIKGG